MTNDQFLTLAEKIGRLLQLPCPSQECWEENKVVIKAALDRAGLTPEEFDAKIKELAGRKRVIRVARMFRQPRHHPFEPYARS